MRSFKLQYEIVKKAPGVVALSKRFQTMFTSHYQQTKNKKSKNDKIKIEIDIVANYGATWIITKCVKIENIESVHWTGQPGHHKVKIKFN